ncbi:hypothetical protein INS49_010463 [Diaporthe citri]|uniref:uncharacterized protein n=1 Tax=Diaporthe citri TaxID=83186 RepID=UPI001C81E31F|nr:uncharacterized protein INS49_010463 [Diaporthe citri]KAG6362233.1 hypothetical protein INS49_010463 [Diaporthe citri]
MEAADDRRGEGEAADDRRGEGEAADDERERKASESEESDEERSRKASESEECDGDGDGDMGEEGKRVEAYALANERSEKGVIALENWES